MRCEFSSRNGHVLIGDLHRGGSTYCVVLCHGFASHRQLGIINFLFERLSAEEYTVFRFDFSGNGESGGPFVQSTYVSQPRELEDALHYLQREHGQSRFVTIGHSMGGFSVLKEAETDDRVLGVINLAGVPRPGALIEARRERYVPGARFSVPVPTGVHFPAHEYVIDTHWLAAAREATLEGFDFSFRHAITIHGVDDERVPLAQSQWLEERGVPLHRIPGDHFFTGRYEEVFSEVRAFLDRIS